MDIFKKHILRIILLLGPIFLLFWPILLGNKIFSHTFNLLYDYPLFTFFGQSIKSANSFLWLPQYLSGFPAIFGQVGGFLNPVYILVFRFFSPLTAHSLLVFLSFALGALSMYWLGKTLGLSDPASVFSSLGFISSQWVIQWGNLLAFASLYYILPLLFISLIKIFEGKNKYILLGIFVIFLGLVSSLTQALLYSVASAAMFLVFGLIIQKENRWRNVLKFLLVMAIGAMLALPWLVPALNLTSFSVRAGGVKGVGDILVGGINIWDLPRLLDPYLTFLMLTGENAYLYLSPIILILGILSFFTVRKNKFAAFFLFLFGFASISSLNWSPLFLVTHHLPIFKLFHGPNKWILLSNFSIVLLAGFCFDGLPEYIKSKSGAVLIKALKIFAAVAIAGLIFVNLVIFFFKNNILSFLYSYFDKNLYSQTAGKPVEHYRDLMRQIFEKMIGPVSFSNPIFWIVASCFIVSVISLVLFQRGRISFGNFKKTAITILIFNFLLIGRGLFNFLPRAYLEQEPPSAKFLKKDSSDFRTFGFYPGIAQYAEMGIDFDNVREVAELNRRMLMQNINIFYGVNSINGYENFVPRRQSFILSILGSDAVQYGDGGWAKSKLKIPEKIKKFTASQNINLLSMMNVKYLLSPFELPRPLEKVYEDKIIKNIPLYIYENSKFLPQIYFARNIKFVDPNLDENKLFAALLSIKDFKKETMVECSDCTVTNTGDASAANAQITIVESASNNFKLHTKSSAARYLVFSQSNLPTWEAIIDGIPTDIKTANFIYQAILVPPGEHEIVFNYPGLFKQFKYSLGHLLSERKFLKRF